MRPELPLALGAIALGLIGGAWFAGPGSSNPASGDGQAWSLPSSAADRHDEAAFDRAFSRLAWLAGTDAAPGAATGGGLTSWRLVGVVAIGDNPVALLAPTSGGAIERRALGAALPDGIHVAAIEGTRVTLSDDRRCTLTLTMPAQSIPAARCPP